MTGRVWVPAEGTAVRGTVILLPGRGELPGVYERFGRRLAFDGYTVHVLPHDGDAAAVAAGATAPVVLGGSDTGALRVLALAGTVAVQGLLLAGVPVATPAADTGSWERELEARTACPVHRARLSGDGVLSRGGLARPVPLSLVDVADRATTDLPVLILHGDDDPVSPVGTALSLAARLPRVEIAVVRGGRHDILNDASHRTVAAHLVQWLERLRLSPETAPVLQLLQPADIVR